MPGDIQGGARVQALSMTHLSRGCCCWHAALALRSHRADSAQRTCKKTHAAPRCIVKLRALERRKQHRQSTFEDAPNSPRTAVLSLVLRGVRSRATTLGSTLTSTRVGGASYRRVASHATSVTSASQSFALATPYHFKELCFTANSKKLTLGGVGERASVPHKAVKRATVPAARRQRPAVSATPCAVRNATRSLLPMAVTP